MTKTTIRGNFPGVPKEPEVSKYNEVIPVKLVARPFQPADRHAGIRGKSKYAEHIKQIMSHAPGSHCVEFATHGQGRSFVLAMGRYLRQKKLYDKLRPALQQMGKVTCVWVVPYEVQK